MVEVSKLSQASQDELGKRMEGVQEHLEATTGQKLELVLLVHAVHEEGTLCKGVMAWSPLPLEDVANLTMMGALTAKFLVDQQQNPMMDTANKTPC